MAEPRWLSHWFSPRNHRGPGSPSHRAFTQSRSTTTYTLIATDIESVRAIAMVSIRSVRRRLRCRTKPAGDPHTVLCHRLPRRCRSNGWMCQPLHRRTDHLGYHSCSTARDRYPGTAPFVSASDTPKIPTRTPKWSARRDPNPEPTGVRSRQPDPHLRCHLGPPSCAAPEGLPTKLQGR